MLGGATSPSFLCHHHQHSHPHFLNLAICMCKACTPHYTFFCQVQCSLVILFFTIIVDLIIYSMKITNFWLEGMWGWRTTVRSARPDWSSVWKRLLRLILPKAPRDSLKEIFYDLEPCTETPWQGLHALNGDKTKHCSGQNQNRRSSPYHPQHHQAVHLAVGQVGLPEPRRVPLFQVLEDKTVPHQEGDSPKQLCWRGRLVNFPC